MVLVAVLVVAIGIAFSQFPRGLVVMAFIVIALAAAWFGLLRTGILRILGAGVAVVAIADAVILLFVKGAHLVEGAIVLGGLAITTGEVSVIP